MKKLISILLTVLMITAGVFAGPARVNADPEEASRATATWDGKKVSWTAKEGVETYKVECTMFTDPDFETETTDLNVDLTDFVDSHGGGRYVAQIYTVVDGQEEYYTRAEKYFRDVDADAVFKSIPYPSYWENDTTGGTVTIASTADETFAPDDYTDYVGVVEQGATVTVTATPTEGYYLKEIVIRRYGNPQLTDDISTTQSPYSFAIENADYSVTAYFLETMPDPIKIIVEMGSGHETLASAVYQTYLDEYEDDVDTTNTGVSGSTLTLIIPALDSYGDELSVSDGNDIVDELIDETMNSLIDNGEAYAGVGLKTVDQYSSSMEFYREYSANQDVDLEDNQKYYTLWFQVIDEIDITIAQPLCGTEVTMEDNDPTTLTPQPEISVKDDVVTVMEEPFGPGKTFKYAYWVENGEGPFLGTFIGGESYIAFAQMACEFGSYIADDAVITINGEKATAEVDYFIEEIYLVILPSIEAVHDPAEPVEENRVEPTETEDGHYDEVVYCKNYDTCEGEISRVRKLIPKKGTEKKNDDIPFVMPKTGVE